MKQKLSKLKPRKGNYLVGMATTIFLLLCHMVWGNPVDPGKAQKIAANFLIQNSTVTTHGSTPLRMLRNPQLQLVDSKQEMEISCFFVFNHGDGQGFVLVSADDRAHPILGYATEGHFEPGNIPPAMQKWLEGYAAEIRHAVENDIEATPDIRSEWETLSTSEIPNAPQQTRSVSPLISTKWNQSPFYNDQCPYDNGQHQRVVTGCVATAMAQVMKYWNWPATGTGFHSYTHPTYGTLSANFGNTAYAWNSMPIQLTSASGAAQKNAVATLMYHCGVSVEMNYGVETSGAYVISAASPITYCAEYALENFFGYKTILRGVQKSTYTHTEWVNLLKTELDQDRPVIYAGYGSGGHCFVCDGYDNNNYFHFNWGWGGNSDGYFAVNALNPSGFSFSNSQQAVIGIEPTTQGGGGGTATDLRLYSALSMPETQVWFGDDFSVTAAIGNYGSSDFTQQLGAAVFDAEGYFIDFMSTGYVSLPSQSYNTYQFPNQSSTLFVPGTYQIALFYKTSTQDWTMIDPGNYTNLKQFTIYYSSSIETNSLFTITTGNGRITQGQQATINVDVTNTGYSVFYGKYKVSLSTLQGNWAQNIQILNENNGLPLNYHYTGGIDFSGVITVAPGTYLMEVTYQPNGSSSWYYCGSSDYANPVYVIVEAPAAQPDIYENNNTQGSAYPLSITFSGDQASRSTTGSNFHTGTDMDYYKIILPAGYNYTLTPRLHDNYNNGNGQTYTVDALFSYSVNGTTYSEAYDDVMSGNIPLYNGGTVYFKVGSYFEGNTGNYLLSFNISRSPATGMDEISEKCPPLLYPNPAAHTVRIEGGNGQIYRVEVTDFTGKIVRTSTQTEINISGLANGNYLVRIHSDQGVSSRKLTVRR